MKQENAWKFGRVEELLVAEELWNDHKKPFFFPFSSAATCTNHSLEVDQRRLEPWRWRSPCNLAVDAGCGWAGACGCRRSCHGAWAELVWMGCAAAGAQIRARWLGIWLARCVKLLKAGAGWPWFVCCAAPWNDGGGLEAMGWCAMDLEAGDGWALWAGAMVAARAWKTI
ncbi:hypothetical protein Taro_021689 [Colocasia esculenta]|uniref:Uncharacterized protein n=1 Tax=Colocasia esculenta TaxID=4460 RepID=A0A843UZI0_COLES|nr:hypothetical protein [Colocasia esculenta]